MFNTKIYQQIDYKKRSFYWKGTNYNTDPCFINNNIFVSEFSTLNNRSYVKVTDVMAKLGGIITIIFMVFDMILYLIYGRKMNEVIIKNIFQVNNSDLDEDEDEDRKNGGIKIDENKNTVRLEISKSKIESSKVNLNKSFEPNIDNAEVNMDKSNINNVYGREKKEDGDIESSNSKREGHLELQKTIKNIEQPRKPRKKDLEEKFEFTLMEHFCSTVFPCCSNPLLKRKINVYEQLIDYVLEYTDIISFSKTKLEVEKLKYVLLSTKQLALFNLISPPENPLKTNIKKKVSMLYKYSKDPQAQIKQAKKYLSKLKESQPTGLDKKLLDLFV
jgi:hypothetical protein